MNIEDYNSTAKIFRQLTNNCIQLLKKAGVSDTSFATVAEIAYQDCYKKYMEKKAESEKKQ